MPHVVVEGPKIRVARLSGSFTPIFERWGDNLYKIRSLYLAQGASEALLDTLVVESGHRQRFFIQLSDREGAVTVRLLPQTDPEKTDGVKRALARVAVLVRDLEPDQARFGATNLQAFLPA